jgi:hypothetical protein
MMVKEERFRSDSKLLRELAEDAYHTCVSAIEALHALLREHDDSDSDSDSESEEEAVVATAAEASDHDCGAAHAASAEAAPVPNPFTTIRDLAPQLEAAARRVGAPEADLFATSTYFRNMGYAEKLVHDTLMPVWAAYRRHGNEAGRQAELEHGGWATLKDKKRVMIYKGHVFERPSNRHYAVPGPLKHLGKYNRDAKKVDPLVPGEVVPVVPQTANDYPWWMPSVARA